ncbi:AI-2E family transporter [Caldimonas tepidiphila]|uniref:AI-2E family transporter n=1 Tax=Caldimonas tepidiphila TaxID=2315841 RepID=UPI000E5A7F6F|nr:permease [Caldimonas tepidiphila]
MSKNPPPFGPIRQEMLVALGSFGLTAALCATALFTGLLPGLLAVCASFLLTRGLVRVPLGPRHRLPGWLAVAIVAITPVVGLTLLLLNAKGYSLLAIGQYEALLRHLADTILEIRQKLPAQLAAQLPEGTVAVQEWLAQRLRAQAGSLALAGRVWLHAILLVYVGLIVGALLAIRKAPPHPRPLSVALRERAGHFIDAFRQIVAAQFWIAAFNTTLTALFLLLALPLFDVDMPYAYALIALTFVLGLLPIVGNLIVNVVLTLVGLSVSPLVGLACLVFLIAIHKFEYFINAKVVGVRTSTAVWELLAVMFVFETIFGVAGLVAAPLYYAYVKKELQAAELV